MTTDLGYDAALESIDAVKALIEHHPLSQNRVESRA